MAAWALKDAKESFDTVFERASGGEPQIIKEKRISAVKQSDVL